MSRERLRRFGAIRRARDTRVTPRAVAPWLLALLLVGIPPVPAAAQTGWGLAVVNGDFFLPSLERGQILRVRRDGGVTVLLDDIHCHSLAPGYDGFIYAESVGTGAGGTGDVVGLWKLGPDGDRAHVLPPASRPEPGIWVARDSAGRSYSWHGEGDRVSRIFRRDANGRVSVIAGGAWGFEDGAGETARFGQVGGIAATPSGVLYLTDAGHLRRVTPEGQVATVAHDVVSPRTGGLPGDFGLFNRSVGLAVWADEDVLIVDAYNLRIVRWKADEGVSTVWGSANWLSRVTGGGLAWIPRGVAISGEDVYVLESLTSPGGLADLLGTPRIRRVGPDGRAVITARVGNRWLRGIAAGVPIVLVAWAIRRRIRRARLRRTAISPPQSE